ncbi:MAG: sensor histidine kinase [Allosphingosinicella sp.]
MLRNLFDRSSFRLCLVLWCFGYLLVDISATLQGRGAPGVMLLSNLPLLLLGLAMSMGLAALLGRTSRAPRLLAWPALAVAVVAAGAVQTIADLLWLRTLALTVFPQWQEWALAANMSRVTTIYLLYTWTFALSLALIWSARTGDIARLNEARAAAFEAAASRAEAAALRLQLNPHFLFNTLNGIASLVVRKKTAQAEEMIGRLAEFLRSSLAADPAALIPLSRELATVRAYLHIEEARFDDRMRVVWEVEDAALEAPVPNFLLQPLIENAVKYGVARARRGATIRIGARIEAGMLRLWVANSELGAAAPVPAADGNTGLGLSNTRQRLNSLYGRRAWVKAGPAPGGYLCELGLPAAQEPAEAVAAA